MLQDHLNRQRFARRKKSLKGETHQRAFLLGSPQLPPKRLLQEEGFLYLHMYLATQKFGSLFPPHVSCLPLAALFCSAPSPPASLLQMCHRRRRRHQQQWREGERERPLLSEIENGGGGHSKRCRGWGQARTMF